MASCSPAYPSARSRREDNRTKRAAGRPHLHCVLGVRFWHWVRTDDHHHDVSQQYFSVAPSISPRILSRFRFQTPSRFARLSSLVAVSLLRVLCSSHEEMVLMKHRRSSSSSSPPSPPPLNPTSIFVRLSSSFVSSAFSSRGLFCSKRVQRRFLRFDGVRGRNSRRRRFRPRWCPRRRRRSLSSSSLLLLLSLRVPLLLLLVVSSSRAFVYLALIYRIHTNYSFRQNTRSTRNTFLLLSPTTQKKRRRRAPRRGTTTTTRRPKTTPRCFFFFCLYDVWR